MSTFAVYKQVFDPVADSLFASALFAMLPLVALFVLLGGPEADGARGRAARAPRGDPRRDHRLLDALRDGHLRRPRGRRVRALPDHVDRLQRDLDLQHDRAHRALRRPAPVVRARLRRRAHPGDHHRLLLRRAARGAGRLRHSGRDHRRSMLIGLGVKPIKAASVALVANTAPVAFGAIAIPIITLAGLTELPKDDLGAMVGRQTPILALIVPADPRRHGRRHARRAPDVARSDRRRLRLCDRPVRLLELRLRRAHRHRRGPPVRRLARPAPARVAAERAAASRWDGLHASRRWRVARRPTRRSRPRCAAARAARTTATARASI